MRRLGRLRAACIAGACWNLIVPGALRADGPVPSGLSVLDLRTDAARSVRGQYVDANGRPIAEARVGAWRNGQSVAESLTDRDGFFRFTLDGRPGGIYELRGADASVVCRIWAPRTEPPQARDAALLVSGRDTARGQRPFCEVISNPLVIATAIAAAIAIPIAVHNSGDDGS
ncbi:MAG: carboxypeptidase regulatory-like domain-containing protein [Planctomycetes bacterium]|nr:carboxypeptidase regulatory-like domain-containing protein [Planctomycetota bacterium]